jgi:regulator of replication initiation timing
MVQDDKRAKLITELDELENKIEALRNENEDLKAIIEQIVIDNMGLKDEVKHMLEETQAMRGLE